MRSRQVRARLRRRMGPAATRTAGKLILDALAVQVAARRGWPARGKDGAMPQFEWPFMLLALLALPLLLRSRRGRLRRPAHDARRRSRDAAALFPPALGGVARQAAHRRAGAAHLRARRTAANGRRVREISKTIGIQVVVDCWAA